MTTLKNSDAEFFGERGFGLTIGFGKRPALIVVDIIRGFTNADMPLGADLDNELMHSNRLIDVCHQVGVPVFFTTTSYDDAELADAGIWALKQKGAQSLRAETDAVLLDARLHKRPTDSLLVKKYASCFLEPICCRV